MTLEEYNTALRDLAVRTERRLSERVLVVGATRLLSRMHTRIFNYGRDSHNDPIGNYSTTPLYVTRERFIKKNVFIPTGKTGKSKFAGGASHKSMFLKEGYKQFREIQGRPINAVNLQMHGDLKLALTFQFRTEEILIGFNDKTQSIKRKALELHFKGATGTIFPATDNEKQEYSREVVSELRIVEHEIITSLS